MADTFNEKELKRDYPVVDGIIAGTTTQKGHIMNLQYENKSIVSKSELIGIEY
jgi:hypothetical protein